MGFKNYNTVSLIKKFGCVTVTDEMNECPTMKYKWDDIKTTPIYSVKILKVILCWNLTNKACGLTNSENIAEFAIYK